MVKLIWILFIIACCYQTANAQQIELSGPFGFDSGVGNSNGFIGAQGFQFQSPLPGPNSRGIGPGYVLGSIPPPPVCSNKLDFSAACNSQYLAMGGLL